MLYHRCTNTFDQLVVDVVPSPGPIFEMRLRFGMQSLILAMSATAVIVAMVSGTFGHIIQILAIALILFGIFLLTIVIQVISYPVVFSLADDVVLRIRHVIAKCRLG